MNRDSVRRRIEKYGRQAGITNVRCSPHTFRHTFAKMSVQNGADLFTLQKILGHKTLDMVRRYVNMFSEDTKRAHERFSPMENLRIRSEERRVGKQRRARCATAHLTGNE